MKKFKLVFGYVTKGGEMIKVDETIFETSSKKSAINMQPAMFDLYQTIKKSKANTLFCDLYKYEINVDVLPHIKTLYYNW